MRDYLFRGNRKDNGEWVEGSLILTTSVKEKTYIVDSCYCYDECIDEDGYADFDRLNAFEVIPETVGQYTGLTDNNGKKIFEGDIVDILTENEEAGIVTYDEGCFYVKADGFSVDFRNNINGNDLLIIGNIHDNPEILKCGDRGFSLCGDDEWFTWEDCNDCSAREYCKKFKERVRRLEDSEAEDMI